MRRGIGFALICLGLFLAVLGGAIRYWAYDRLVVLPIDLYNTVDLTGRGTYLDLGTSTEKAANVITKQTIRADVGASSDGVLVVDISQVISTSDGKLIRANVERAALDRRTGAAVNCCGESVDGKPVKHHGYLFKLPFNTPRHDVLMWDSTAADVYPAVYQGVDTIAGHRVYKFVTTTPAHQIRTQADSGRLVGEARTRDVPVWNQSTKTVWIEPVTGTPLAIKLDTKTTLRNSRNQDKATVFAASMQTDKANPNPDTLALVDKSMRKIQLVEKVPPLQVGVGGLLASIGVGLLLLWRRPSGSARHAPISPAIPTSAPPAPVPVGMAAGALASTSAMESMPRSGPPARPGPPVRSGPLALSGPPTARRPEQRPERPTEAFRRPEALRPRDEHRWGAGPPPDEPRWGAEPPRQGGRPGEPGEDRTLARYIRPYLDDDTGFQRRPPRPSRPPEESRPPQESRPQEEGTGAHRRPNFGESTGAHRRPPIVERTGAHRRPPATERATDAETTGAHRWPPAERPTGSHRLLPGGDAAHDPGEDTGSYRRLAEEDNVQPPPDGDDWFSQIRPEGHGRHGRLDPDEWSSQYDAPPPVAPPRQDGPSR
jgi:hypothetical protein